MTEVHPVAALFPMLPDDELAEMAADIKARGLLQPIVRDGEGRILDGRNRDKACAIAGVQPRYETYEGDDPPGYALAVNTERRSLRPSQKYMIKEMARRLAVANGSQVSKTTNSLNAGEAQRMAEAATVLDHAPGLVQKVVAGDLPLHLAVETARENKRLKQEEKKQQQRLIGDAPDLLNLYRDEQLTLADAIAALNARELKAKQEMDKQKAAAEAEATRVQEECRKATRALASPILVLTKNDVRKLAGLYDPEEEAEGQSVTQAVIKSAIQALEAVEAVWLERELP